MKAGDVMNVKIAVDIGWMVTITIAFILEFIETELYDDDLKRHVVQYFKFWFYGHACAFGLCHAFLSV